MHPLLAAESGCSDSNRHTVVPVPTDPAPVVEQLAAEARHPNYAKDRPAVCRSLDVRRPVLRFIWDGNWTNTDDRLRDFSGSQGRKSEALNLPTSKEGDDGVG